MAANLHENSGHVMEILDERLNINDLPQELLVYIFSFLNIRERIKIERVCKNWRYIGTNFQWKIKNLKDWSTINLTDYMLEEILKRCGNSVLAIDLSVCSLITPKALSIIGDLCPNLRSIKFNVWFLSDSDLEYFSSKYTKLKEAVLENSKYGEEGLRRFLKSCQELEVLHIQSNNNITGLCFQFISPKVKKLTLTHCTGLTPEGVLKLGKCKCIEHLELNNCPCLDTASLQEILKQNCNSLKHLRLKDSTSSKINYPALPLELLIKLESISFRRNRYIKDDALLQIAHKCKNLRTLDIRCTNITDVGLNHLTSCPLLTTLDVSCIKNITDESIIPLAMVGKLESLTIRHNHNITDNACNALAVHCAKLKFLDLTHCTRITDATARSFINAMELRNDGHRKLKIFASNTEISVSIEDEDFIITEQYFLERSPRKPRVFFN